MKDSTGLYPRPRVDTSGVSAVGQAGGVMLTETVRVSGLDAGLSAALGRWRKPTAVHDPAKVVCDLDLSLALGGDCLADVAVLRGEAGVFGRVASDPTVSRTIDVLAADAPAVLKAIDGARAAARARVWGLAGTQQLSDCGRLIKRRLSKRADRGRRGAWSTPPCSQPGLSDCISRAADDVTSAHTFVNANQSKRHRVRPPLRPCAAAALRDQSRTDADALATGCDRLAGKT